MPSRDATRAEAVRLIDAIESEMRRIGFWQGEPLSPAAMDFRTAFAMDTMAFSQWLQFVFVPTVRTRLAGNEPFPSRSDNAAQAVRELDGMDEARDLISLLAEFDKLINESGRSAVSRTFGLPRVRLAASPRIVAQRFGYVALAILWVLAAIAGAILGGHYLNRVLPRKVDWDLVARDHETILDVQIDFQARLGTGSPAPVQLESMEVRLRIPRPRELAIAPDAQPAATTSQAISRLKNRSAYRASSRHTLVYGPPAGDETPLDQVTLEMVRKWLEELVPEPDSPEASLSLDPPQYAPAVYDAIDRIRSAPTTAELYAIGDRARTPTLLKLDADRPPREHSHYLKDWALMLIGVAIALAGLAPFYRRLFHMRLTIAE